MLKKVSLAIIQSLVAIICFSQNPEQVINKTEVERIEKTLSADELQGRQIGTPGIRKAAEFIAGEFKKAGLQFFNKNQTYLQSFGLVTPRSQAVSGSIERKSIDPSEVIVISSKPELKITDASGYKKVYIKAGANLVTEVNKALRSNENVLVLIDTSFHAAFPGINRLKRQVFESEKSAVFVLSAVDPKRYEITSSQDVSKIDMSNVVGVLPGRSRKNEYVIFSGHYDHLGIGKAVDNDSIFNGANDDAAGITAVIMLAKYFKALGNNERTLVFAAFTGEETGGFGSQYFSKQFNPDEVVAMFNIEMIGTESKWGRNSAYITGYDQTNMGKILERNLEGSAFKFYPDPYPDQQLFYRSDNATLARLGVPAHTISTSKMDSEKFYHTVNDEFETLDMENMALIIKAIALSSKSIVGGQDAPSRVNTETLR